MKGLIYFIRRQMVWSRNECGEGKRTKGITGHIRKELLEIEIKPEDLEEWVDVMMLALDGAWRAGHTPESIVLGLRRKQSKNFLRKYRFPKSEDEVCEHVR